MATKKEKKRLEEEAAKAAIAEEEAPVARIPTLAEINNTVRKEQHRSE